MMNSEIRILMLEDTTTDAELAEMELRETGLSFIARRVETRELFIRALEEFKPDIVLVDYQLPAFDGAAALKIVRQQYPSIPVVMVSGALGDEKASELLKLGARDYVLKDRRALEEERGIRARKAAAEALRLSEAEIRSLDEHSPIATIVSTSIDADEKCVVMNRKFTELFGYSMEDIPDLHHWWPLAYPDENFRNEIMAEWTRRIEKAVRNHGEIEPIEAMVACKDGARRYVSISFASISSRNIITFVDLTERRQMEEEREATLQKLQQALEDSIGLAASITEKRDPYTAGHQRRVSQLATAIAAEMGLSAKQVDGIHFGGLIHDVGKIGIPAEILSKPSRLQPLERELVETHSRAGYEIVKEIEFP